MAKKGDQQQYIFELNEQIRILSKENERLKNGIGIITAENYTFTKRGNLTETIIKEYALNNSIESIIIFNNIGNIIYANNSTLKSLGYTINELQEQYISIIDPSFTIDLWPSYWANLKKKQYFFFFFTSQT